jgi:hypothetical protein
MISEYFPGRDDHNDHLAGKTAQGNSGERNKDKKKSKDKICFPSRLFTTWKIHTKTYFM